ncbi:hypothetical protein [Paraburkholderia sp.]|uniref:hypothetical protein n=1 Tax=Paraburkholderia sp. TaxID=1926495 RepID=UPI0039E220FE
MSMADVFAPVEARNRAIVMHNTWGHLAPEPRRIYRGEILFAHGEFGDLVVLRSKFRGLPDSPWFYEHLTDFASDKAFKRRPGAVLRFEGTYTMFKNGNGRFSGKVRDVRI